jgi:small subunit ribosomal protein S16
VAVKIRLKRLGQIRQPQYRIVVADSRTKRDGRVIEEIGIYHPKNDPSTIVINSERALHWLNVGAQPTEPVLVLLKITGDWQKFKDLPGKEGTLRVAEPKASKLDMFNVALADAEVAKNEPKKAPKVEKVVAEETAVVAAVEEAIAEEVEAVAEALEEAGVPAAEAEEIAEEIVAEAIVEAVIEEAIVEEVEAIAEELVAEGVDPVVAVAAAEEAVAEALEEAVAEVDAEATVEATDADKTEA